MAGPCYACSSVRDPAGCPCLPASRRHVHASQRILPAAAMGGVRCPVCVDSAGPGAGRLCAAAEGRVTAVPLAGQASQGRWAGLLDAVHAEWTKLRTVAGPGTMLLAAIALTAGVGALAANA